MPHELPADQERGGLAPEGKRKPETRNRSRRRLRSLILIAVVLTGLVTAAVFYARTEDALQRFYVPLAGRVLDADIKASGLEHAFPLAIGLERLEVFHHPTRATLLIEELRLKADALSLVNGSAPRLRLFRASSLSLSAPLEVEDEESEIRPTPPGFRETPWISLHIDRLDIDALDLRLTEEGKPWLSATLASLRLADLTPGTPAPLSSELDVTFTAPASGRTFIAGGQFDAVLRQPEEGRALAWEIDWPLDVRESPAPDSKADPLEFSIIQHLEGSLSPAADSEHALQLHASRLGEPAGALSAQLRLGAPTPDSRRTLQLDAVGESIRPVLLNPILAAFGPESLSEGRLDGRLRLNLESGQAEIDSELQGRDLRLAASPDHGETPPLSVDFTQQARLDNGQRRLHIERTSMSIKEDQRQLVTARLTAPFQIRFDDAGTTAPATAPSPPTQSRSNGRSPARLEFSIDRVDLDRLKPWTAAWGGAWPEGVSGGTLSADLNAEVAASARSLTLGGNLEVRDLLWSTGEDAAALGPFSIRTHLDARSPDLDRFSIQALSTDIESSGKSLGSLNAKGSFNRESGALSGRVNSALPDLPFALNEMRLIDDDSPLALEAGSAGLNLSADRQDRGEPIRLRGEGRLREVTLLARDSRLVRSAAAEFSGDLASEKSRVEAIRLVFDISDTAGAGAGTVEVEGYWPTAFEARDPGQAAQTSGDPGARATPSPPAGRLGLRARDFDLKPWFELFGLNLQDPEGPAWPASADLTLTVDPFGEIFTLEGEERLGPVEPDGTETAAGKSEQETQVQD